MYYDMEKSGRRIKHLRILKGYSQEKLAILLNRDRSFLSAIETGKKGCSMDILVKHLQEFREMFAAGRDPGSRT